MNRTAFPILATLLLAACASPDGDYPSLAIRDGERMTGSAESAAAAPVTERQPLSTDTATRVKQLRELGLAANVEFAAIEARASRLVLAARGTAITTKANASAQIALAELQSAHQSTLAVLAELDVLLAEATIAGALLDDITTTREAIGSAVADEQAALARLSRQLPSN